MRATLNKALTDILALQVATGTAPLPTVTLSSAVSHPEGNSGTTAYLYTVTRSISTGAVNVPWTFAAGPTSASDYVGGALPTGGVVAFADGAATGTFNINVAGDTTFQPDGMFTVSITAPAGYAVGTNMSATGTIVNDDASTSIVPPTGFALNGSTNPKLKAMLARVKAGTGRGLIVISGDSTDVGQGGGTGSAYMIGARPTRIATALAAALTTAGYPTIDHGIVGDAGAYISGTGATLAQYDPRLTNVVNVVSAGGENFAGGGYLAGAAGGGASSLNFTEQNCDSFAITFYRSNVGTWSLQIAGDNPASGGSSYTGDNNHGFITVVVKASSVGTHTLSMSIPDGSTAPAIMAIRAFDSTTPAIDIIVLASAGAQTGQQGATNSNQWGTLDALTFFAPDFTISGSYYNDPNNSVPLSTTTVNLQAIATAAKVSGDVLQLIKWPAGGVIGGQLSTANPAIESMAAGINVAHMSLYEYYGQALTPALQARMSDGVVHANTAFYQEVGGLISTCIQAMAA